MGECLVPKQALTSRGPSPGIRVHYHLYSERGEHLDVCPPKIYDVTVQNSLCMLMFLWRIFEHFLRWIEQAVLMLFCFVHDLRVVLWQWLSKSVKIRCGEFSELYYSISRQSTKTVVLTAEHGTPISKLDKRI